jgi:signal transduction histidine kinase
MIDDDEEDFIIIRDIIEEIDLHKFTIDWVQSYEEGLKKISEGKYDVFLIDYLLGARTGAELVAEAKKKGAAAPMIILTGQNNVEADHRAIKAGAVDFLVKSEISPRNLEVTIRYNFEHARHIQEIKKLNAELEEHVRERTLVLEEAIAELEQTKLELGRALKKERELNELKSRFVSMASHEFRTPLAAVLSSLSLISQYSERNEKEKQLKHIERAKRAVHNLTDIIEDMLSVSKLEEGKTPIDPEKFDITEFVTRIAGEVKAGITTNQVIAYTHSGNAIVVQDKKILRHIIINLLSNAIKFSTEGKSVELTTELNDELLIITVKDYGIGISEADQEHLFERFFRGQNVTNIQGTGLGLNIVAKYVELLKGKINFESQLNKGTTFTVTLPAKLNIS